MSAAAVIAIRRRRLVRKFREAGATDRDRAVRLDLLDERPSWVFEQMRIEGVFLPGPNETCYMDDRAATEFLRQKRKRAFTFAGVLVLVFLCLWVAGLFGR